MAVPTAKSSSLYPILTVTVSMVGFICIKTGRDAVFFAEGGLPQLPLLYVFIAIAAIPAAMMHLEAISRWRARRTRITVFRSAGLVFLALAPFADRSNGVVTHRSLVPGSSQSRYARGMSSKRFVYWKQEDHWLGYFEDFPDYWTQGETLEDLKAQLRDLYRDLTSGEIPGIRKVAELRVS